MNENIMIDPIILKKGAHVLRALDNRKRRKILELISLKENVKVKDIYRELNMDQSEASYQLKILRTENMVYTRREGKNIYYSINQQRLEAVQQILSQLVQATS